MNWVIQIVSVFICGALALGILFLTIMVITIYQRPADDQVFNQYFGGSVGLILTGLYWDVMYYFYTGKSVISPLFNISKQFLV